MVWST